MKKVFALLLTLVLLLTSGAAFAGDEYAEPILFRGAAWGSSFQEVVKVLPEGVKMYDPKTSEYWYPMSDMMYDESGWGNQLKGELGCYAYAKSSSLKGVKVAGYEVEDLYLYFIFTPDSNGKLVKDDFSRTAFYYGYYKLEPKDPDAVFDDLVNKLSSIYGDIDEEKSNSSIIDDKMALWNGADGTMVSIFRQDYSSGSHYIYIKYGFTGGDDLMQAAYEAVVREETESAGSNIDGL